MLQKTQEEKRRGSKGGNCNVNGGVTGKGKDGNLVNENAEGKKWGGAHIFDHTTRV